MHRRYSVAWRPFPSTHGMPATAHLWVVGGGTVVAVVLPVVLVVLVVRVRRPYLRHANWEDIYIYIHISYMYSHCCLLISLYTDLIRPLTRSTWFFPFINFMYALMLIEFLIKSACHVLLCLFWPNFQCLWGVLPSCIGPKALILSPPPTASWIHHGLKTMTTMVDI